MRSFSRILFVALLLVPCVALAAETPAPAPSDLDLLLAGPAAPESLQSTSEAPTLDVELGLPQPILAACTITDSCRSCSRGLQFCRKTCCNGTCSTSCGVCGAC